MKEFKEAILDLKSGEVTFLEFDDKELVLHQEIKKKANEKIALLENERTAKKAAKQAAQEKLKALGLSPEEIAAITGA